MSIENITKEEWDKMFKTTITLQEEEINKQTDALTKLMEEYELSMKAYKSMIELRAEYRKDFKLNRIIHQIDMEEAILTYKLGARRKMGYDYKNKQDNEERI